MAKMPGTLGFLFLVLSLAVPPARSAEAVVVVPERTFPEARQPQVAVDPAGTVYVAFGSGDGIHCAISRDGGKNYEPPVKVGQAGVMALGMRRGPRVAAAGKAVVVTAICGEIGKGRDGDLLAWRSTDSGKTWQGPVTINSVAGAAREGLHHSTAAPSGLVYCTWLDLREKGSRVYGAASSDGGANWHSEKMIYQSPDGHVCPCCQPQAAFDPQGQLHVMWRNDLAGARDMYLTTSKDGGKSFAAPVKLGQGTWPLKTCPMDGGGLAGSADGAVMTIWMRRKEVFRAEPGKAEVALGKGEQPWAAWGTGGFYLVWIVGRPGPLRALLPGSDQPVKLAESVRDPVVAGSSSGRGPVIAAWEEAGPGPARIRAAVLAAGR
jgi:hypothetical protein